MLPAREGLFALKIRLTATSFLFITFFKIFHLLCPERGQAQVTERGVDTVITESEQVVLAPSGPEMVRHARLLGQATARLITDIKVSCTL